MKLIKKYQLGDVIKNFSTIAPAIGLYAIPAFNGFMQVKKIFNTPRNLSKSSYDIINKFEGTNLDNLPSVDYGKDIGDANGHKTYGPGLLIHPDTLDYMDKKQKSYTANEIKALHWKTISNIANAVSKWAKDNNLSLNQNQFDAIVSGCHNFGLGFLKKPIMKKVASKKYNSRQLKNQWIHLSDAQTKYPGLKKRRAWEAELFFSPET